MQIHEIIGCTIQRHHMCYNGTLNDILFGVMKMYHFML